MPAARKSGANAHGVWVLILIIATHIIGICIQANQPRENLRVCLRMKPKGRFSTNAAKDIRMIVV